MKTTAKPVSDYYIATGSGHGEYALYRGENLLATVVCRDFDMAIGWAKKEAVIEATDAGFVPGTYYFAVQRYDDYGPHMLIEVEVSA